MSERDPDAETDDPRVCFCMKVPLSVLRRAIAEGARTVGELSERTGAGTGCGTCRFDLFELLAREPAPPPGPEDPTRRD